MNTTINKFLLTGDKFMPKLHFKQPGSTTSACGTFTKHCEIIKKFRETVDLKHSYRNKLDEACFVRNAAYSDGKDLAKRTISDKILNDRAYEIARNRGYDGYQRVLASMVYKFFDKKTESGVGVKEQLAEELHKPVIKKFKRRKVFAKFNENIWAANLAEMETLSSQNKNVKYLLCSTDTFAEYIWVKPIKDKKGKTVLNAFIKIVNESNRKPNKLWADKERKFYKKLMQEWLGNNDILMYSTYNAGKSMITERFVKTLKAKTYKKVTANDSKSCLSLNNFDKLLDNTIILIIIILIKNLLMLIILL